MTQRGMGKALVVFAVCAVYVGSMAPAGAQQQTAANPVTDAARILLPTHEKNIVESFVAMPEAKYGFRAKPELMTFGEMALHIADANFYYCRMLSGRKPSVTFPKATAPKEELVNLLRQSFDFCRPVIAEVKDVTLAQPVGIGPEKDSTRALLLIEFLSGMDHHYCQTATFLRLNDILPPTARTAG